MSVPDVFKSDLRALAKLLETQEADAPGWQWTADELSSVCRHQLEADLEADLPEGLSVSAAHVRGLCESATPAVKTFSDVLFHKSPPTELLELTKQFAKLQCNRPDGALPEHVATVIYYAAIAAGLLAGHRRISTLPAKALKEGFTWALREPWLDQSLRGLLERGASVGD